jgi:hypothetical protein
MYLIGDECLVETAVKTVRSPKMTNADIRKDAY